MSDSGFKNRIISSSYKNQDESKIQKLQQTQNYTINSDVMLSQESQQTESYLISDGELSRKILQNQNGISQHNNTIRRHFVLTQKELENLKQTNEDYINVFEDQEQNGNPQQSNQNIQQRTNSKIVSQLFGVDEQIEIIEDDDSPTNKSHNEQLDKQFDQMIQNQLEMQQFKIVKQNEDLNGNINGKNQNQQVNTLQNIQTTDQLKLTKHDSLLGNTQKAKLKDEPDQQQSFHKQRHSDRSRSMSMNGHHTNGQRLWAIVRRDIFYPIKFHGKIEFGLHKKRKMKFRGSQSEIIFSQDPSLFIHPHGQFKIAWDFFIGLSQLYFPLILPIRISFGIPNHDFIIFDMILDFIFILDMFFSCITGINQGGEIVKDRYFTTKVYLKTYFIWDLFSVIPFYFFYMELCYVKIFRIARYWDRYLLFLNRSIYFLFKGGSSHKFAVLFYYLFKVSSLILLCIHVMACWWIEIGTMPEYGDTPDLPQKFRQKGWVTEFYEKYPNKPQYGTVSKDIYISAYYFVTTTIATVGYGDFSSKSTLETVYTMFCEFFGIALFGYISGGLISAVQISLLMGTLKKSEKRSEFDQWLYQREKNKQDPIFTDLLKNLRAVNHFNSENNFSDFFNDAEYFHHLPKEQKRRVFNLIFTDIATFFGAFFRNISELSMIQDMFQYMHPLTFLPGDEVIKYKSLSRGIYFIVSGKVYIKGGQTKNKQNEQQNDKSNFMQRLAVQNSKRNREQLQKEHFRKLKAGSFFGEFCLLEKNSAYSLVVAGKQPLNTLFITKKKMYDICQKYKETFSWLKKFSFYRFKYFKLVIYSHFNKLFIQFKTISPHTFSNQNKQLDKFWLEIREEK